MPKVGLSPCLAVRAYRWQSARKKRTIELRLGKPRRDRTPGGDWICHVEFTPAVGGLPRGVRPVHGVDALQALVLALGYAQRELRRLQVRHPRMLTWLDAGSIGIPAILDQIGSDGEFIDVADTDHGGAA